MNGSARGGSLTSSATAVLTHIATAGPSTRPTLSAALGLSKPTISVAVRELEALGLVAHVDTAQGVTGRSSAVYGLGPQAGYVLGMDVGNTKVKVVAASLDGMPLLERERPRRGDRLEEIESMAASADAQVAAALRQLHGQGGPLRGVLVAVPHTVNRPETGPEGGPEINAQRVIERRVRRAGVGPDVPVQVENNVNCAALAELTRGSAQGRDTFAVLQVGIGIGLAVVAGGNLMLGANGVAGEPAYLPYPWGPQPVARSTSPTALEHHLGAAHWIQRVVKNWRARDGEPPKDASALFQLAENPALAGHVAARRFVDEYAREIGQLAVAVSALLDPGVIILGGGVGSNPLLLEGVRESLSSLPWKTDVRSSTLGRAATIIGATQLATTIGLRALLAEYTEA